jgi:GR25 family glycosyltransferase involved in LPS biosynthesis
VTVGLPEGILKKSKSSCKRSRSLTWLNSAEDTGRLHPVPAKRCKLVDAGGEEPSEEMRGLEAQVVNLERRPDRLDGCVERLRLNCPWLRHTRFAATDGRKEVMSLSEVVTSWNTASNVVYQKKRAIRKGWNDLDSYQVRELELSAGERGCALSHIRAWQYCLERAGSTNQPLLVLEDDAAPTPQFTSVLRRALTALPKDAHLLYLGYSQAADWRREVSENLVESEYVWTTVGYIVWPAGARILLSRLPVDGPVDNWMAGQCAAGDIKAYAVRPKIVLQADAWNVNSDVAHSDEHYWGPSSDIHHSDAFYWGNPTSEPARSTSTNTIWANLDEDSEESEDSAGDDF